MKVVMTSRRVSISEDDLKAFDGLDVEFRCVDGATEEELIEGTRGADAIIVFTERFTRHVISQLDHCRSLTRFGIGYDTIDVAAATAHGVWVTNVPDANYREVAVHAIALALALSRRLPALDAGIRRDGWTSSMTPGVRRPDTQTFGLLGVGRIGRRVAAMAAAIGYTVVAYDPFVTAEEMQALGVAAVMQDELIERSDILSLHLPLTDSNRNIIDAAMLKRMRHGAILINVSRGGLVDETALADALGSGHLLGAGIDAFSTEPLDSTSPLRQLDNVLLSPHAAHWSEDSWNETRRKVLEEVARILRGEPPRYAVNQPRRPA